MNRPWSRLFRQAHGVRRVANQPRSSRPQVEALEERQLLTTYPVITAADSGAGSLRQAILDANAHPNSGGPDLITFTIPGTGVQTITPLTPLPALTDAATINGYTQPGSAKNTGGGDNAVLLIQLDGYSLATHAVHADGLTVQANNCLIEGLVIGRFLGTGVTIATGNASKVQGNFIGTDPTGTQARTNWNNGVAVVSGATNSLIGGGGAGVRNLLSGNGNNGVLIANSTGNRVQGNFIGTDATGKLQLANMGRGVFVTSADPNHPAANNLIGGATYGLGNLISGNLATGVRVDEAGANNNKVQGNLIGTDITGNIAIGNGYYGVLINGGASHNLIGGTTTGARNVISGNNYNGVAVASNLGLGSTGNAIQGNYIGTNRAGMAPVGNSQNGVLLQGVAGNVVGGSVVGAGNLISGNDQDGVYILDYNRSGQYGNTVQGNLIGTDVTGFAALRNRVWGVILDSAPNNLIGGAVGNVISGNGAGIAIYHVLSSGNKVQGNLIGVGKDGVTPVGNTYTGVDIDVAGGNLIGGLVPAARNVISGNGAWGIVIDDNGPAPGDVSSANNVIEGNFIGTLADGVTALGNAAHGVWIGGGGNHNAIGGTASGAGNTIAFNGLCGVTITDTAIENSIVSNAIYGNGALGIDLAFDGPTPNHAGGGIAGQPNGLLNYPVITAAVSSGGNTTISGTYNGQANTTFTLQFFANPAADPSGFGQGQTLVGTSSVTTNASGNVTFTGLTFAVALTPGEVVSATGSVPGRSTSEFSADFVVTSNSPGRLPVVFVRAPSSEQTQAGRSGAGRLVTVAAPTPVGTPGSGVEVGGTGSSLRFRYEGDQAAVAGGIALLDDFFAAWSDRVF